MAEKEKDTTNDASFGHQEPRVTQLSNPKLSKGPGEYLLSDIAYHHHPSNREKLHEQPFLGIRGKEGVVYLPRASAGQLNKCSDFFNAFFKEKFGDGGIRKVNTPHEGIHMVEINFPVEDIKQVVWLLVHGSLQLPKNPETILDLLEFLRIKTVSIHPFFGTDCMAIRSNFVHLSKRFHEPLSPTTDIWRPVSYVCFYLETNFDTVMNFAIWSSLLQQNILAVKNDNPVGLLHHRQWDIMRLVADKNTPVYWKFYSNVPVFPTASLVFRKFKTCTETPPPT